VTRCRKKFFAAIGEQIVLTSKSSQEGLDSQWEGWQSSKHIENSGSTAAREQWLVIKIWTRGISKFCSNFKVLGMRQKWCHCVCLVFLIPTVYLLSQTESVWRSYRDLFAKANRQKFDADCTCLYSPYGDVAKGRMTHMWQLMWQTITG
jgi:hypothetical protein